jgi:hypothetical protein
MTLHLRCQKCDFLDVVDKNKAKDWVCPNCRIKKMTEWISVNDRLPEDYEYVLVYAKTPGTSQPCPISFARQYKRNWEMLNLSSECNSVACGDMAWFMSEDEITHWMPLPKSLE